ncbi:sigma-70 family RNA polymerase sigma factor [Tepidanaerobacter acetatoxydans]|uniref:sigma-70 family RNA polymerase sigma factor n=1 Tax=Tepidanaerobacter acetatoxydans TaxID=499229 RepID=UPI00020BF3E5|nr:sigma-70 family RNA polymerase sigma factor [Tepidanaerobacter acetatoxydans]AEE92474.1 RNA polymerase, sigma-24 subunit, ECF subfamily [Tepidanaerobacter acetatoxydans Re1]
MIDEISFKRAKNKDAESFYKLLEPIKDRLYRTAFMYMKNEDDALDCVHDSIVKAIQSIDSLREPQYFNTWITRITINTCKDNLRKSKNTISQDTVEFEGILAHNDGDIEENVDLHRALDNLKDDEKELIAMRYMEDMSIKDIAKTVHSPMGK